VLLLDVPIMPILFFLAGYFALRSLQKRGTWLFLKDKLVRIGMPMSFLEFWRTDFWTKLY
jgi:glucan biosynthesis protein C